MLTPTVTTAPTKTWDGIDRRTGKPKAPLFGELLIESEWRPSDVVPAVNEGWLRSKGFAPDRRED